MYYRLIDNWLELPGRFVTPARGVRDLKDAVAREVLDEFDAAGIGIASATVDIVGFPPLRLAEGMRVTAGEQPRSGGF